MRLYLTSRKNGYAIITVCKSPLGELNSSALGVLWYACFDSGGARTKRKRTATAIHQVHRSRGMLRFPSLCRCRPTRGDGTQHHHSKLQPEIQALYMGPPRSAEEGDVEPKIQNEHQSGYQAFTEGAPQIDLHEFSESVVRLEGRKVVDLSTPSTQLPFPISCCC